MKLVSCHLSGACISAVAPTFFWRNLCTLGLVVTFFLDEKVFSCFYRSVTRVSCSRVLISSWRNLPSDRQHDTTTALTYVIKNTLLFPCSYQTRRLFSLNKITQTVQFSLQVPAALVSLSLHCNVPQNSYLMSSTTAHQAASGSARRCTLRDIVFLRLYSVATQ
jgi:hypothetical protein